MDKEREVETPDWKLGYAKRIRETFFKSNELENRLRFGFAPSEPDAAPIDKLATEIEFGRSIGAAVITAHISFGKWVSLDSLIKENCWGKTWMVLSHCNTLKDDELDAVKRNGVGTSSTPDTEFQMGMCHPVAFRTPSNISAVPHNALPKLLLTNTVYHQCFCALHGSTVPLFCGIPGDNTWP